MSIKARAGEEEEGIWKHNQDCSFSRRRRDMPPPFRANRDNSRFSSDVHFNLSASYLKRADQSVSGQFHQHLNTTPPSPPSSISFPLSPPLRVSFRYLFFCSRPTKQPPSPLDLFAHRAAKREARNGRRNEEKTGRDGANGRGERERERKEGDGQVLKSVG